MKRRFLIIAAASLIAAVVALAVYVRSGAYHTHLPEFLEKRLSEALGVELKLANQEKASYGSLELYINLRTDKNAPLLYGGAARVDYGLMPPRIQRIDMKKGQLRIRRLPDGTLNIDPILNRPADSKGTSIPVGAVHIGELAFIYTDELGKWTAHIPKMEMTLPAESPLPMDKPRLLNAQCAKWRISTEAGELALDGAALKGEMNEGGLRIDELRVWGEGVQFRAEGVIDPKGNADLKTDATFQLDKLRLFAPDPLEGARGSVALKDGRIAGNLSDLRLEGGWEMSDSVFLGARLNGTGRVNGGVRDARLDGVRLNIWGGKVDMSVETGARAVMKGDASNIRLSELFAYMFPEDERLRGLEGRASGSFELVFEENVLTASSGTWRIEGLPYAPDGARGTHLVKDGRYRVQLNGTDGLTARLEGEMDETGAAVSFRADVSGEKLDAIARGFGETAIGRFQLRAESMQGMEDTRVWAELNDGALRGIPIPAATFQGVWRPEARALDEASLEIVSGAGSVLVKGEASFPEDGPPRVQITAEASNFAMTPYVEALDLGALSGRMSARGPIDALDGAGELRLDGGAIDSDAIPFDITQGRFQAPALKGRIGGVPWTGEADSSSFALRLERPASFSEAAALLPAEARAAFIKPHGKPHGQADGNVDLQIKGVDGRVEALLRFDDVRAYGLDLGGGNIKAVYETGGLDVKGALDSGGAALEMTAQIDKDAAPFQASLQFHQMDAAGWIQQYAPGVRSAEFTGGASIGGDLYRLGDASADMDVESARLASDGAVLNLTAPFTAFLSAEAAEICCLELRADENGPPFHLLAAMRIHNDGSIDANIDAPRIHLKTAAELLGAPARAEGVAAFNLDISGTADDPVVKASWSADRLALHIVDDGKPLLADNLQGRALYQDGIARIERVAASFGAGSASLSGRLPLFVLLKEEPRLEWAADAPMDIRAEWSALDMSALLAPLSGWETERGAFSGQARLTGTLTAPTLDANAQLNFSRLFIPGSGTPLMDGNGRVQLGLDADGRLAADLQISGAFGSSSASVGGTVSVPFRLYPFPVQVEGDGIEGALRVESTGVRLSDALALVGGGEAPLKVEAAGAADIQLKGLDMRSWTGSAELTRLETENGGARLMNADPARIRYERGAAYIDRLRLEGDGQALEAVGWINVDGRLDMQASAENLDLRILSGLTPLTAELVGRLSGRAAVNGSLSAPQFQANWTIADGSYDRIAFDSFAGSLNYDGKLLTLNGWELTSGVNALSAEGFVPAQIGWRDGTAMAELGVDPMRLLIDADSFDISFFPLFLPQLKEASGLGTIRLKMEGPARKPSLIGSITLENGALTLAYENIRLENVSGLIEAEPQTIALRRFEFTADSGTYRLGGQDAPVTMSMDGLTPMHLNMSVKFADARVESWLPHLDIETRLAGFAAVSIDVRSLSRRAAGGDWTAAGMQALKSSDARIELTKADIRWAGLNAEIAEPLVVVFNQGAFRLNNEKNRANIRIDDQFQLTAHGRWNLDGGADVPIECYASAKFLQSEMIKRLGWAPPMEGGLQLSGRVAGADGEPPVLNLNGAGPRLADIEIEEASAQLESRNGLFKMTKGGFRAAGNTVDMTAEMPWTGIGFAFTLDADIQHLDFIPLVFPHISYASGVGSLHLSVGGSAAAPRLVWRGKMDNLALKMPDADINLSGGSLHVSMADGRANIETMQGALNGGMIRLTDGKESYLKWTDGEAAADVSFEVGGSSFNYPIDGIAFQLSDGAERASLRAFGPLNGLTLEGSASLASFQYQRGWRDLVRDFFNAGDQPHKEARYDYPILREMALNIQVQATSGVVIEFENARFSADIDGRLVGRLARFVFEGEASNIAGRFSSSDLPAPLLLTQDLELQVLNGSLVNSSSAVFDPTYTIEASTVEPLRGVTVTDTQDIVRRRDVDIDILLEGRLSSPPPPDITPTVRNRDPGETYAFTLRETWQLLATGDARADTGALAETGIGALAGGFGTLLGVQRFGFDLDADSPADSQFHISKEFLPRLFIHYSSMLDVGQEQRVEFNYGVTDRFSISGERNEEGKYGADLQFSLDF